MSLVRSLSWVVASAVALGLSLSAPAMAQDVYPADQCVSDKFQAAGEQCRQVLKAWAKWEKKGDKKARNNKISKSTDTLKAAWKTANKASSAAGASCDATAGAGDMSGVIAKGGKGFAKYVSGSLDLGDELDGPCASRYLKAAADACRDVLAAQGTHIAGRDTDRDKAALIAATDAAWDAFETAWDEIEADSCDGDASSGAATVALGGLVEAIHWAGTVTTKVDTEGWERIVPEPEVDYAGRVLDPQCWDGAEYNFFAQRGTVNKLIVYYQGGGACWNGATCGGVPAFGVNPTFKQNTGPGDNPDNFDARGLADFDLRLNPFRDWHKVFVPYCTGDVHWGDATVVHTLDIRETVVNHKGYVNAQVVEKWTREHFADPEQVFMTGSSAGAYGAIVNSLPLKEKVYPATPFAVVGDAGNGVITDEFLEEDLSKWGIEGNLPDWIPAFNVPIEDLDAADLWAESAAFSDSRYATFTTAYDGGTGGQTGFYNIMANLDNPLLWGSWWGSSCDWNPLMTDLNEDAAERADNYRYYVASGSAHTTWGRDRVYSDTTGGVSQTFVDWLNDMLEGSDEEWQNVTCEDCSILHDGDPRPPFEGETRPFPFETEGLLLCDDD